MVQCSDTASGSCQAEPCRAWCTALLLKLATHRKVGMVLLEQRQLPLGPELEPEKRLGTVWGSWRRPKLQPQPRCVDAAMHNGRQMSCRGAERSVAGQHWGAGGAYVPNCRCIVGKTSSWTTPGLHRHARYSS